MNHQAKQDGVSLVRMDEFITMCLLAKVKVGRDRVFEEVDDEIPEENEKGGRLATQLKTLRHHLDQ